ncbi:tRNA 2-thiouridine(34) synthase MnmA [Patescibacteria group bacterium]|nr:tRNA 2-thiouridine(34) synthase MnmA [Patescibacteria group bacterium]
MNKKIGQGKKVFVGLSGGVDSAVSAYLLLEQGYDVHGVFMKNWTGTTENLAGECNWTKERDDAKAVAKKLGIPFTIWDFERQYRQLVVDYFFKEYQRGRTPNPDIRCNQFVKIPLFLKQALKAGADYIATGHYARVGQQLTANGRLQYYLMNGVDKDKDQSYFLYTLNQQQLKHLLFPIGELSKKEVRLIAKKIGLSVASKPDSVGICFIGQVKIDEFLKTRLKEKSGLIMDVKGKILGQHIGLSFYTVGQRHGLGLSGGPWYVVGRRWLKNILIVGNLKEQKYLLADTCSLEQVKLASQFKVPATYWIRHRYRHPVVKANLFKSAGKFKIKFLKKQRAITPGQSAVFYTINRQGLRVVGGGVIKNVENRLLQW